MTVDGTDVFIVAVVNLSELEIVGCCKGEKEKINEIGIHIC